MITGFKVENDDLVALHNNNGVLSKQNLGRVIGADGHSPYIGANNNWYYWDEFTKSYIDSGVQASGGSKIRIDYMGGNRFLRGSTQLNFNDLYTMHLTGGDFVFVIYNDRAYLCSFINYPTSNALKEMRFESVINADNRTKVSSIYVISNDGVNIVNTTVSDINSENSSNKVAEITESNVNENTYPSTLAVERYAKPLFDSVTAIDDAVFTTIGGSKSIELVTSTESGLIKSDGSDYVYASGKHAIVPVSKGMTLTIKGCSYGAEIYPCAVVFKGESVFETLGKVINTSYGYDGYTTRYAKADAIVYTVPDGVTKIAVNGIFAASGSFVFNPSCVYMTEGEKKSIVTKNPLVGKKIGVVGDSICFGNGYRGGYGKIIAENNEMTVANYGIGATMITTDYGVSSYLDENGVSHTVDIHNPDWADGARYGSRSWDSTLKRNVYTWTTQAEWDGTTPLYREADAISKRINKIDTDCDYVVAEGGLNDYLNGMPLGTVTESLTGEIETRTLAGGMELLCRNMVSRFPGKKLGFILIHRAKDYPHVIKKTYYEDDIGTLTDYFDVIKSVCKKYAISICNLYDESPLLTELTNLAQTYTRSSDGVHPNEDGYKLYYVDKIERWLRSL